ncbi:MULTISPECIES: hypothetical protein [unclassified Nocardia]|uniref:hypothetical protein n=1 Tax=unclassified Nocardia TaxID=2637762 RepID=UPI00278C014D|nr:MULTISPECIES: hypothetical protein [unclassified Nocardia]
MAWNSFDGGTATLTLEPALADRFVQKIEADLTTELKKLSPTITVGVDVDTATAQAQLNALTAPPITVGVDVDTSTVQTQLDALTAPHLTVELDADTAALQQRLDRLHAGPVTLGVDLDLLTARTQLNAFAAQRITLGVDLDRSAFDNLPLGNRTVTVNIELDNDDFYTADAALAWLARTRTALIDVAVNQGQAAALAQYLDWIARNRTARFDVEGASGLGAVRRNADNATRSLRAMSVVKFGALVSGIGAIAAALGGLVGLAGGVGAALVGVGGVAAVGSYGLGDAFAAQKAASESAADDATAAADAQASALDAVDAANQRVASSQQRLNQAYRDAGRELRDLKTELTDAELNQEDAAIAVARARENLERVRRDPESSRLDIQEADLRVRQAESRYDQSKTKTADLRVDVAEADAKGIEGSDTVQDAQQELADAQKALADAENALAEAGTSAGAGQDALNQALEKLAPNTREFFEAVVALGPAWSELRREVSNTMFDGLGESLTTLADNQLPALQEGMVGIAGGLNTALKDTFSSLDTLFTDLTADGTWSEFVDGMNSALSGMAPTVSALVGAFAEFGAVVGPTLGPLFESLAELIKTISPALAQMGAVFSESLTQLMPVLGEFITALAVNLAPVIPVIATIIGELGKALTPILPQISELAQVFGNALAEAIRGLAPALPPLMNVLVRLFKAIEPIIPVVADLVVKLVDALAPAFTTIIDALAPVIEDLAEQLSPIIAELAPVIGELAAMVAESFAEALKQLAPHLPSLAQSFGRLLQSLLPLLPPILQLALSAVPPLVKILEGLMPVITDIMDLFTELIDLLTPVLIPVIENMGEVFETVFNAIADVATYLWDETLRPAINDLKEAFKSLQPVFEEVGKAISKGWDLIVSGIAKAAKSIGEILQKVPSLVPNSEDANELGDKLVAWAAAKGAATGGPITGPGTGTSDEIPIWVSNGEYVINAASTEKHRDLIEAINEDRIPRFATGGPVNALDFAKRHAGIPYLWGGASLNGVDCSGWVAMLQQVSTGVPNPTERFGSTDTMIAGKWPQVIPGADADDLFAIGTNRTHMAATILGVNVESASGVGARVGGPVGAFDPSFTHQFHVDPTAFRPPFSVEDEGPSQQTQQNDLDERTDQTAFGPVEVDEDTDTAGDEAGGSKATSLSGLAGDVASAFVSGHVADVLGVLGIPDRLPPVVQAGLTFAEQLKERDSQTDDAAAVTPDVLRSVDAAPPAVDSPEVVQAPDTAGDGGGPAAPRAGSLPQTVLPAGQGLKRWRPLIADVLAALSLPLDWWAVTEAQIAHESGGSPAVVGEKSGQVTFGLLQLPESVFSAAYSVFGPHTGYPAAVADPRSNIAAGLVHVTTGGRSPEEVWGRGPITSYADGGRVRGPGGPRSDLVPAWLSDGEYVMTAAAVDANAGLFAALNSDPNYLANSVAAQPNAAPVAAVAAGSRSSVDNSMQLTINTPDVDSAFQRAKRWEAQRMITHLGRWTS